MQAQQLILRITKVEPNGTIVVMGRCGNIKNTHVNRITPCHLPHMDGTIDPALPIPPAHMACKVCNFPDDDAHMLLCDFCNMGWCTYCLDPPLEQLPPAKQSWLSLHCLGASVTNLQLKDIVRDWASAVRLPPPLRHLTS